MLSPTPCFSCCCSSSSSSSSSSSPSFFRFSRLLSLYALISTLFNFVLLFHVLNTDQCRSLLRINPFQPPPTSTSTLFPSSSSDAIPFLHHQSPSIQDPIPTPLHLHPHPHQPFNEFPYESTKPPVIWNGTNLQTISVQQGFGPMKLPKWLLEQEIFDSESKLYFGDTYKNGTTYGEHYQVCIYQCDNRIAEHYTTTSDISIIARISNYLYARQHGYHYFFATAKAPSPWGPLWNKAYFHQYMPALKFCDYIIFLDSDAYFSHHEMSLPAFFKTYAPQFPHSQHFVLASADGAQIHGPNSGAIIFKNTLRVPVPAHNYTRQILGWDPTRQTDWTQNIPDPTSTSGWKKITMPEKTIVAKTEHQHPGGFSNMTWQFIDDWFYLPARNAHYFYAYTSGHQDNVAFTAVFQDIYYDHTIKLADNVLHRGGQYIHHNKKDIDYNNIQRILHGGIIRTQARQSMAFLYGQCTLENYYEYKRLNKICQHNARNNENNKYQPIHADTFIQQAHTLLNKFLPDFVPTTE